MLIIIAPARPVYIPVIIVAVMRHVMARIIVLLCVSVIFLSYKKAPYGAD